MRRFLTCCASVAALVCAQRALAAVNLLTNGDFETPAITSPYSYRTGSQLTGWTISGSNGGYVSVVQFDASYRPVDAGLYSLQIEVPGVDLSQSFATDVGGLYRVSLDLSAWNAPSAVGTAGLGVDVGTGLHTFSGTSSAYVNHTFDFTATSLTTTIVLSNLGPLFSSYPHIDNVSVTAIPETATVAAMFGVAALVVVGLRRWRSRRTAD